MQKVAIILFLMAMAGYATAQTMPPLQFESISGLSQNTVYSVTKDKQGFMWIATANGLNRFDGAEMKAYKPGFGNVAGLMKGRIIRSALIEDEEEQIWFATDLSINCFNKKKQKFVQHKLYFNKIDEQSKEQVPTAEGFANPLVKKDNYIWLASYAEGVFAVNVRTRKCIHYPVKISGKNGNNIPLMYNAAFNGKEKLWFASINGLLCFDINRRSWSRYFEGESFYTLSLCNDTLYLGTKEQIQWFDTRSLRRGKVRKDSGPAYMRQGMIRRIYTDEKMNVWAGDQVGNVYCKTAQQKEFVWKGNINGNSGSRTNYPVYCLYADTIGNLWVGADVLGLLKAKTAPNVFKHYPDAINGESSQNLFIHSIYEDENKNIWLGTFQNGVIIVNKKTGNTRAVRFAYFDPKLPYAKSVPLIKKDKLGNIWTSYSGQLYVKENGKNNFLPIKFPVPTTELQSPQLWSIADYNNGWLAATNTGLYFVEKKETKYSIRFIGGLNGLRLIQVWVAPNGQVWVVAETKGIFVFNNPDKPQIQKRLFPNENIKSILYDEHHQLMWISSANGLIAYHVPSEKYRLYKEEDGLLNNFIYSALLNKEEIWLSTNHGLSKGIMAFKNRSVFPQISFINFTKAEGLPGNEFNTGAFHKGQGGNFYFGSTNGVVWFNPEEIKSNVIQPRLQLINFLANEERADSSVASEYISSISLPYTRNNLFFRFRGINFNDGNDIRYKYRLEGWDKDWIYSNQLNEVRYNNLPNGKYLFKINAATSSGIWNIEDRTVSIVILPPFWKTWWFYSLSTGLILITIILITNFFAQQKLKAKVAELEKQKEIDRERQRISREMHDDIGAGLTQITLMSESAKNKLQIPELNDIAGTSRQLVNNMSEIIWSLNPENKSLDQLCAYLREELTKQLDYSEKAFSIILPENRTDILLSNEQRRNILLVTKEIVNNAVKYSKANNIEVKAELEQNKLKIKVRDDGTGFDTEKIYPGNGLKNIRSRIKECGGELVIQSRAGGGSQFSYSFPVNTT